MLKVKEGNPALNKENKDLYDVIEEEYQSYTEAGVGDENFIRGHSKSRKWIVKRLSLSYCKNPVGDVLC